MIGTGYYEFSHTIWNFASSRAHMKLTAICDDINLNWIGNNNYLLTTYNLYLPNNSIVPLKND